jgi:hypothetical protein
MLAVLSPHLFQAFRLDTASDLRQVVEGQSTGIPQMETLPDLRVAGIAGLNPEALKIDDLRDERRMLAAASVGPIDMGTQVMSVARVGPTHRGAFSGENSGRSWTDRPPF